MKSRKSERGTITVPPGNSKESCTGCGACAAVCLHLEMTRDEEGFGYPVVDQTACISCGLCRQVCPMVKEDGGVRRHPGIMDLASAVEENGYPRVFAAWNKNEEIRRKSSSGGIFSLLAEQIILGGGVVVGAAFDDGLQLRHHIVDSIEGLAELRGSKYIQSDAGAVFSEIKIALEKSRKILFTGTPCQVAGLTSYLGGNTKGLLTCDIVCHGVPSEKVFRKYIKELEQQHGGSVTAVSFRDKKLGWKRYSVKVEFANGGFHESALNEDSFMRFFLSDLCLRPSCYTCPFATIPRQGDITLGDYSMLLS